MQSKGQTAAKVIGVILVLLLLAGLVAVVYRFTNGFNEDFKTFYVEHNGNQILTTDTQMSLEAGEVYRFDVKYTFDTENAQPKDYNVKVVPNVERDFDYTVDGERYLYSKTSDLTGAFGLSKQDTYFEITIPEDMSIQKALESCYPGQSVVVPDSAAADNPYPYALIVSSYNESVVYHIYLSIGVNVTSVSLDQTEIVFTEYADGAESLLIGYDTLGWGSFSSLDIECPKSAKPGDNVTVTASIVAELASEYKISRVSLDSTDTGDEIEENLTANGNTYTFVMPEEDVTLVFYIIPIDM